MKKTKKVKVVWEVDFVHNGDCLVRCRKYHWRIRSSRIIERMISSNQFESVEKAKSDFLAFAKIALKPGSWKIIEG